MAKLFKVIFELGTEDEDMTKEDISAEIDRFAWSSIFKIVNVLVIKKVKVKKQRPYWITVKCPKCKKVFDVIPTKDNVVETGWTLGTVAVKLELKCEKCGHAFSWAEQINPLRFS